MSLFLLGYTFENKLYNNILSVTYDISYVLCGTLTMNAFTIFYTAICCDLRNIIENFQRRLSVEDILDYEGLLYFYSRLKSSVGRIDPGVGPLVFTTTAYNTLCISNSLYLMLCPNLYGNATERLAICYVFLSTFGSFLAMTISASMMTEASSEVGSKALILRENKESSSFAHQRFIICAGKDITQTVWNIIPIKRNFSFCITGIIITYALMFYSVSDIKN
ncbi:hypothetical protein AVEN_139923-1 [Araneus ventricosus]|uniref:Uncharacterized protein n=1 Tax=Araneus ventricosus TaxID=182803 RepID=A0A4Y2V842_ARAVE|nr:hypothetical protein AVEN_139923-1 [Araneus ventricosus]